MSYDSLRFALLNSRERKLLLGFCDEMQRRKGFATIFSRLQYVFPEREKERKEGRNVQSSTWPARTERNNLQVGHKFDKELAYMNKLQLEKPG